MPRPASDILVTRVVLLGSPGAGKGTQARRLAGRLGVPHVASGDLFRRAIELGTPLGTVARGFVDAGELIPDELTLEIVLERIDQPDTAHGFILDGFPRTLRQAEALDERLDAEGRPLERVVELQVPTDQLLERIAGRATHTGRSDDRVAIAARRLEVYLVQTAPLVDYYRARGLLVSIDGAGSIEAVADRVEQTVERSGPRDEQEAG